MKLAMTSESTKKVVDGRDIGVRKHAVLWTAMPGHDGGEAVPSPIVMPALVAGIHVFTILQQQ